ncbi:MAG: nitroreductase family protein [Clostridia bacterium]|nr:nitroreductase family protein [Clostridia bacterium]
MNTTIEQLKNRKSCRAYENKPIPPDIKRAILDSALQAPSAGNMTLYTILDITDEDLKKRLSVTCDNQPFIAEAPMVLVFLADYYRWYKAFRDNIEQVRQPEEGDFLLAQADAIIAAQNTVVAAESLGIGSCYIGDITENFEIHREILSLPDYVVPACMLCFGYPAESQIKRKKPTRHELSDIVHENIYNIEKADRMNEMLMKKQGLEDEESYIHWLKNFCKRKWNSDFSVEMSRSVREMIKHFCKKS